MWLARMRVNIKINYLVNTTIIIMTNIENFTYHSFYFATIFFKEAKIKNLLCGKPIVVYANQIIS